MAHHAPPAPAIHLTGNHEAMLVNGLAAHRRAAQWRYCGGLDTLASYGIRTPGIPDAQEWSEMLANFRAVFPSGHAELLSRCRTSLCCGSYFLVHAGIWPSTTLAD